MTRPDKDVLYPLQLRPEYREYVWGGSRLRPDSVPTAEAWVIYEMNQIIGGALEGWALAEVAEQFGEGLLGRRVLEQTGQRFPLLVKLLDCAQWLSLQVHPNDLQAVQLEGPNHFGKTEAWHVLEADPGAQIIAGLAPGVSAAQLAAAIENGLIEQLSRYLTVQAGDSIFMAPGTIHALGPGLFIYEVQQTSDLTYRVYDWGRPQTASRKLHIAQSLAVANPAAEVQMLAQPPLADAQPAILADCPFFTLELAASRSSPLAQDTGGQTFHALTVLEGAAEIQAGGHSLRLGRLESAVIPAACGQYTVTPRPEFRLLKASVPAG